MTSLRTALARHRRVRDRLRAEREIERAIAAAPTVESAHELTTLARRL